MNLKNRVALITGGARIGRTIALELVRRGCHVAVTYRKSRDSAAAVVGSATSHGVKGLALKADVGRESDLKKIVPSVERSLGRLDILVNMASLYRETPLSALSGSGRNAPGLRSWGESLDVDLRSAFWLSLRAAPLMRKNGGGRIVNFSDWISASGRPRYRNYLPYYVAKSGVKGLTESLALELAPEILVNAVAPGPILPPPDLSVSDRREVMRVTPLKKWGGPGEIAKAVLFLIETDFVTGECLRVDGGRHLF